MVDFPVDGCIMTTVNYQPTEYLPKYLEPSNLLHHSVGLTFFGSIVT